MCYAGQPSSSLKSTSRRALWTQEIPPFLPARTADHVEKKEGLLNSIKHSRVCQILKGQNSRSQWRDYLILFTGRRPAKLSPKTEIYSDWLTGDIRARERSLTQMLPKEKMPITGLEIRPLDLLLSMTGSHTSITRHFARNGWSLSKIG